MFFSNYLQYGYCCHLRASLQIFLQKHYEAKFQILLSKRSIRKKLIENKRKKGYEKDL